MNKNIKKLIILVVVIIVLSLMLLAVDCLRLNNNHTPIFCISFGQYLDGGTS